MKVLMINTINLEKNGVTTFILNSCKSLRKEHVDIDIAATNSLSEDINDLDWRSFQQEYRDYIDLAKLLQLLPGIGAFVGAYVNNKLVDKLGEYAMYAYRMRILSDEVCVTKKTSWFSKIFKK